MRMRLQEDELDQYKRFALCHLEENTLGIENSSALVKSWQWLHGHLDGG